MRLKIYITPEHKHYYPNVQPHRKMYSNNLEAAVSNYSAAHLIDGRIRLADDYFNFARALSNPRTTTSTIRLDYFKVFDYIQRQESYQTSFQLLGCTPRRMQRQQLGCGDGRLGHKPS